ncbi:radical SAM protein [Tepidimicrobium xylanilyticum]|uniref:Glycine radical enzyme activase, YjjW family n=1 Tax=Tepidimicrobium xylanilyticum TaxID=1123352 RepID=A0A1H3C4P0_9FIRM|nr:radical SAM protein [Tepidimicrobium xylanilyticum]GMG95838.1 radical SAM domain protein [Tepidimicrobium xylanilyticum]SDX48459.1 glycine radical enzyme activase, YjjW family [Tepidimicrobium xylanilyticum]
MIKAPIRRIIAHSLVDGLGNRTAIFLQGCNLKCAYCHNPETQKIYTELSSKEIKWMTAEEVFKEVEKNIPFIRGITASGGECILYPEFLTELFTLGRKAGLSCLIDTNGTIDLSKYPGLMKVSNGVMIDVKAWDEEKFKRLTGGSNKIVKKNLRFLADVDKLEEIRIVCIEEVVDTEEILKGIKASIGEKINSTNLRLIKFRNHGVIGRLKDTSSPTDEYMNRLKEIALKIGFKKVKMS